MLKHIVKKTGIGLLCAVMAGFFLCPSFGGVLAKEPLVIVIDPGHGGENLGAEYGGYTEKELTMTVAKAMKEELEKFEQVVVYLTHDTDVDMSIEQRALFAREKNADFLFCLHFNMSAEHDLFGAEVWVPAGGEYYAKGYSFAEIEMAELTETGLYSRGIKTKLNDRGDNYYGILRYCSREQVPSVLIEHCHLDHEKDQKFYQQSKEQLKEFGRLDALAAAKYFKLRSEELGVDYSDYPVPETAVPSGMVMPDKTKPELCRIEVEEVNKETGDVTVRMEASDSDSYILYYKYSLDGGNTYSMADAWPRADGWNQSDSDYSFTVRVPFDKEITFKAAASNGFDVWAESNEIVLESIADPERLKAEAEQKALEEEQRMAEQKALDEEQRMAEQTALEEEQRMAEQKALGEDKAQLSETDKEGNSQGRSILTNPAVVLLLVAVIIACMFFVAFYLAKSIFLLIKGNKKR